MRELLARPGHCAITIDGGRSGESLPADLGKLIVPGYRSQAPTNLVMRNPAMPPLWWSWQALTEGLEVCLTDGCGSTLWRRLFFYDGPNFYQQTYGG